MDVCSPLSFENVYLETVISFQNGDLLEEIKKTETFVSVFIVEF